MNAIMAPPASTADRVIATLATYLNEHSADAGGGHQRTMLIAALISRLFDITPARAVQLAREDAFDDRVQVAERALTEILTRVQTTTGRWAPKPGDTVTHTGTDGTWTVHAWEDDDTVWIHRPNATITPTIGLADSGMADILGWHNAPEQLLLAVVAELRPVETAAEVTL